MLGVIGMAVLTGVALMAAWSHDSLRPVGLAFIGSYILIFATDRAFATGTIGFEDRVIAHIGLECMVGFAAFLSFMLGGSRALALILMAALVSVCASVALMWVYPDGQVPPMEHRHLWNAVGNITGVIVRVVLIGTGWTQSARSNRRLGSANMPRLLAPRHVVDVPGAE